ncbi:acid protease [Cenococcum geophilum 1.58]|uniref:Acid protease n=1 Tax=Cenococcum geophilum 1.58 TaxID=794803 RepID=A0ACC8ELT6_9PEZI|nr:acid protease [Cenococcum geophilum 1.58]
MPSLRFFLLVALLATIALAHPSPARRKLVARSFKVPRSLNPDHPTGLNGGDAMAKVYRKFGWGLIGARHRGGKHRKPKASTNTTTPTTTTPNTTQAETGEVAATPEQNAALFLSPVTIGGQTLNMDFDTGSSDLWVFSSSLSQATIGSHSAFDPTQSKTFEDLQGATFSVSYGDGSGAAGTVGTDTVDIGGATVTSQAVELATAVSQSFVADASTDGLVGLAFSTLNTVKPTQQKTFFDNIMDTLDEPVFTANLKNDTTGTYEFGKIDNTSFQGDLSWVPVNAASGFWEFNSTSFTINGKTQQNPTGSPAIADTGTSLLLVDDAVAQAYYAQVQGAVNDDQAGGFTYPCTATLPDFGVAIGDSYVANVPGNQITFAAVDAAGTTCFGGVQSNGGATLQIYGDTMFKAQFVAFNGGNQSLGFAPKA